MDASFTVHYCFVIVSQAYDDISAFASHGCMRLSFLQTGVESSQHRAETLDAGSDESDDSAETGEESLAPVETITAIEAQTLASRSMGSASSLRQGKSSLHSDGGSSLPPVHAPAREYIVFVRVCVCAYVVVRRLYLSWSLLPNKRATPSIAICIQMPCSGIGVRANIHWGGGANRVCPNGFGGGGGSSRHFS